MNKKILVSAICYLLFIGYWCFTIRPVFLNQMRGNFQPLRITPEYVRLKDMLVGDTIPSRVLWIPQEDTFSYTSNTHPMLLSNQLFDNASISAVIAIAQRPEFMSRISDAGVGYVIVPADLEERFFLDDYRFNVDERSELVAALNQTTLKVDSDYTDVAVFKNNQFTMKEEIPLFVRKQQQWATIGLYVSVTSVIALLGILMVLKHKK
jgi:hypothetical protein